MGQISTTSDIKVTFCHDQKQDQGTFMVKTRRAEQDQICLLIKSPSIRVCDIYWKLREESDNLLFGLCLGSMSVFAGMPGRLLGKQSSVVIAGRSASACIDEWHKCVKHLTVSSRENQAHHLIEGQEGFWQSAGTQGKVCT